MTLNSLLEQPVLTGKKLVEKASEKPNEKPDEQSINKVTNQKKTG